MCPKCSPDICENQKRAVDALELLLGVALSHHACTGNQTQVLSKKR